LGGRVVYSEGGGQNPSKKGGGGGIVVSATGEKKYRKRACRLCEENWAPAVVLIGEKKKRSIGREEKGDRVSEFY